MQALGHIADSLNMFRLWPLDDSWIVCIMTSLSLFNYTYYSSSERCGPLAFC